MRVTTDRAPSIAHELRCWSKLWRVLGLEYKFRERAHTIHMPGPGCYDKRRENYSFEFNPAFWLPSLECYVDLVRDEPTPDQKVSAARMYGVTGYPVAMFRMPLFVPNWRTMSPPATMCREVAAKRPYFLQVQRGRIRIAPMDNQHDVICQKLQDAVAQALI